MSAESASLKQAKLKPPKQPRNMIKGFALPYIILCIVFVIVPLFIMVYYAFSDGGGKPTFENFLRFFRSWGNMKVLLRSFLYAIITTVICFVLAYPVALILTNSKLNRSAIMVMLFILPMWINSLLRIYSIKVLLEFFSITPGSVSVIIGLVYDFFPFMLLPIYTILSGIDKSYIEAAGDLGASPAKTLLKVKLPLSVPGIVSGVLMVFMPTVSNFAVKDMLGGTDMLFGNIINDMFGGASSDYNYGAALSFIMLLLVGLGVLIARLLSKGRAKLDGNMHRAKIVGGRL